MDEPLCSLGVLTDVQYADKEDAVVAGTTRQYRHALIKLRSTVEDFNAKPPDAVLNLGDIIDGRETESLTKQDFEVVMKEWHALRPTTPLLHAIGNHCLSLSRADLLKGLGADRDCQPRESYLEHFLCPQWSLLVLDTNDVGVKGSDPELTAIGDAFLARHGEGGTGLLLPEAQPWNGGVGSRQLQWMQGRLRAARVSGRRKCIVAGHHPMLAAASSPQHRAFNHQKIIGVLESFSDVVPMYLAGHYHKGGYAFQNGVHHVTLEGMIERGAHAVVNLYHDRIDIVPASNLPSVTSSSTSVGDGVTARSLPLAGPAPRRPGSKL